MTDKRELIRSKVFESAAILDSEESWFRNTVILADGTSVALEGGVSSAAEEIINEIFEIVGEDKDLWRFMLSELDMHAKAGDYNARRKERLGWKPGMTIGTPDVSQDVIDEYVGVTFHCEGCGMGEE